MVANDMALLVVNKKESEKKRELNFELLRIISMFLIVMYHFSDWGGVININDNIPNKVVGCFLNIFGNLGVNLFVLISGYFLINSKFKFKKLLRLIAEVFFYSVILYVVCICLKVTTFSIKEFIRVIFPISYNMYWFATTYIGLYLISPFINKLLNTISRKEHKKLMYLLIILVSIIPTILIGAPFISSNLIWFVVLYIIAAYIQKYKINYDNNKKLLISIIAIFLIIFAISVIAAVPLKLGEEYESFTYFNKMNCLPMLALSMVIFMFFKNLKIPDNKIIPFISKATFGVYLIHINTHLRTYLFKSILKIQNYYNVNTLKLIGYILLSSLGIFVVCVLIDTLRRIILEKNLFKINCLDKYFDKIDDFIN